MPSATRSTRRVLAAATVVAAAALARSRCRSWGSRPHERAARLPGDELVPDPADTTTMGVTVHATPQTTWRWLVQIGQGRGGWYSYDWLENLLGLDIHSADEVRPEWQRLRVGDPVVTVRPGWRPLPDGYALTVARVEPARALVLRQQPPESPWDGVWSFHLMPDGPGRTRLLSRGRTRRVPGPGGVLQRLGGELMAPATFVMTRAMLLGIKRRAERSQRPLSAAA